MTFEWHIFLWHIVIAVLFVYMCISFALFLTTRRKLFLYYVGYLALTFIYLLDKNDYGVYLEATALTRNLNWYLQIVYHFIYFWFTFEFLNYFKHYPKQEKRFKQFTYGILTLGSLSFLLFTVIQNSDGFLNYFLYFHVPLVLLGFLYGIVQIFRVKEPMKLFYIPGMLFYICFSLIALLLTFAKNVQSPVEPITYFYIGILIETTMFSIGLGYLIKNTFEQNLKIEKELNTAKTKLQKTLETQLKDQELESELSKMKVYALQNQMNSHFIFNILNSLKTFIIENDKTTAVNFLNKYAKLMRIYLNGSNKVSNHIDNEIKAVKLYIDLENQRLNNSIEFDVNIDPNMNLSKYQIPTHLLIPFLENAIWKGLFHREEDGKKLTLKISEINNRALIQIKDNGHYNGKVLNPSFENEIKNGLHIAEKRVSFYNQTNLDKISYSTHYTTEGGVFTISIPKSNFS